MEWVTTCLLKLIISLTIKSDIKCIYFSFSLFILHRDVSGKLLKTGWCALTVAGTVVGKVTPHVNIVELINNLTIHIFFIFLIHITWYMIMGSFSRWPLVVHEHIRVHTCV